MPRTLRLISWTPTSYSRSRINAVAPGAIYTDMSNLLKTDEGKSFILGMQALKRIGQPDDVGSVVAFLAPQDVRWMTCDTIPVHRGSKLWALGRRRTVRQLKYAVPTGNQIRPYSWCKPTRICWLRSWATA